MFVVRLTTQYRPEKVTPPYADAEPARILATLFDDFWDCSVDIPLMGPDADGREGQFTMSLENHKLDGIEELEHMAQIWYRGHLELWGQITGISEDFQAGTAVISVYDRCWPLQDHYLRHGDEALIRLGLPSQVFEGLPDHVEYTNLDGDHEITYGNIPSTSRGLRRVMWAARNTPGQTARGMPDLGVDLGDAWDGWGISTAPYTPERPFIGQRDDNVLDTMRDISRKGPDWELEPWNTIVPHGEPLSPHYAKLNTFSEKGADDALSGQESTPRVDGATTADRNTGLELMRQIWSAAQTYFGRPRYSMPRVLFVGPPDDAFVGCTFETTDEAQIKKAQIIWPDWMNDWFIGNGTEAEQHAARDVLIHEWVHYFQLVGNPSDWQVEGGAQAWTRRMAPDIYAAIGITYVNEPYGVDQYTSIDDTTDSGNVHGATGRVEEEMGEEWILSGQFRPPEGLSGPGFNPEFDLGGRWSNLENIERDRGGKTVTHAAVNAVNDKFRIVIANKPASRRTGASVGLFSTNYRPSNTSALSEHGRNIVKARGRPPRTLTITVKPDPVAGMIYGEHYTVGQAVQVRGRRGSIVVDDSCRITKVRLEQRDRAGNCGAVLDVAPRRVTNDETVSGTAPTFTGTDDGRSTVPVDAIFDFTFGASA